MKRVVEMMPKMNDHDAAIYGESELIFNVHCLQHICEDARNFGSLDTFSAFPFESYLQRVRRMVHGTRLPTSQIFRRIAERSSPSLTDASLCVDDTGSRRVRRDVGNAVGFMLHKAFVTTTRPNNAVIVRDTPYIVLDFRNCEVCV